MLLRESSGVVDVSLAVAHAGTLTLDLEISAPTCFFRDTRYVAVPAEWRLALDRSMRWPRAPTDDVDAACGFRGDGDHWVGFATEEMKRKGSERASAFAGRLAVGTDHFVRVELDLASMLTEVPRDLATVIVVDRSKSMTTAQLAAQRELVLSYMRKAPASRIQIVAFSRTAHAVLPSWSIAGPAITRVDRELRALAPTNGSNIDVAIAQAGEWLGRIRGTRRVVVTQ